MQIRTDKKGTGFFSNVSAMFIIYWGILVLWQNISGATTRGTIDVLLKTGLLGYFSVFYLLKAKTFNAKGLVVALLALSLLITLSTESRLQLSTMIAYVYPVLVLFLVYGLGDDMQINRSQLVVFCNCVIGITAYAAIYAVVFCWDQFAGALSLTGAYGNELSSFFVSNFEYGVYLVAAIISCVLCLSLSTNLPKIMKILYVFAMAFFFVNLVLTFSRTTILCLALFLLIYLLTGKKKVRRRLFLGVAAITLLLLISPEIQRFVSEVVFKSNTISGRDVLFQQSMEYFQKGSLINKFFGFGYVETREYFKVNYSHGSVHNGYLQVLLYYGLACGGALIIFMLSQAIVSIKTIKKDRNVGSVLLGLNLGAALIMVTTTAIVFTSSIDSFFVTVFFILVPKYVRNSIYAGTFYD